MKSKLVRIYVDKNSRSIFIRPTQPNKRNNAFISKSAPPGEAKSYKISNEELGKLVRRAIDESE